MLTERQKQFCLEYIKDFNVTGAMMRVGYAKSTASQNGWKMLQNPEIAMYLKQMLDKVNAQKELTAGIVIEEIRRLAMSNISDYYKLDAKKRTYVLKELHELTREQTAAISKFDKDGGGYTLYNKDGALDKLAKYFKLYSEVDQVITNFVLMPELKIGGKPMEFNIGEPTPKRQKKN